MFGLEPGTCGDTPAALRPRSSSICTPNTWICPTPQRGYMEGNTPEFAKSLFENGMMGVSPCGIVGDALPADAEKGRAFFELFCRRACACVRAALA